VASRRWHIMPILISNPDKFKQYIYAQAKSQGFDLVGITTPEAIEPAAKLLEAAIIAGHHGTMAWMEETLARRTNPRSLMPDLHSIIMLAVNYGPDEDPLLVQQYKNCGAISVYARHRDYHDLIKGRLKQLASQLKARACQMMGQMGADEMDIKVFVDTAPVMEKPLAAAAGLGWQGKHTNLVNRQLGSWLFLGSIFTNIVLDKNVPENFDCNLIVPCSLCRTKGTIKQSESYIRSCLRMICNKEMTEWSKNLIYLSIILMCDLLSFKWTK